MNTNSSGNSSTGANQMDPANTKEFNRFFWRKILRIGLGFVIGTIVIKEWDELKALMQALFQ